MDSAALLHMREPRVLTEDDLPACLALTRAANWNQTADDWRTMLDHGRGWGIATDQGDALAASTVVLPFEGAASTLGTGSGSTRFAWISMVLVLPSMRGHGLASRLLAHALCWLAERDTLPILDATPAGEPVYRRAGFVAELGLTRYRRAAPDETFVRASARLPGRADPASPKPDSRDDHAPRVRRIVDADWPALLALDAPVFGGDRHAILRALARRAPDCALVAERHQGIEGFVFARDGHTMHQVGPLMADDDDCALALLDAALAPIAGASCIDLFDARASMLMAIQARGFARERPFRRMRLSGDRPLPGEPSAAVLAAGPELG